MLAPANVLVRRFAEIINMLNKYKKTKKYKLYVKEYNKRPISRERIKKYNQKRRIEVLQFYSKGKLQCNCCGEKEIKFLCIDHKNNDGYKYRKNKKRYAGTGLYSWIISHNFPNFFQVLCHNCNLAKGFYGKCPHKL